MSINTNLSLIETNSPWAENGSGIDRAVPATAMPTRNTIVPETLVMTYLRLMDEGKKSTAPQVGFPLNIFSWSYFFPTGIVIL